MRKTLAMALLVLALGCPSLAGEMHTPPVTQPPQPPQKTAPGDMLTPPAALIDALLSLLSVALP